MNGGGATTQETQYRVRLHNAGTTAQSGLSIRVFVNLSELFAAGLTTRDVVADKFWDQCGAVAIGPLTAHDTARSLYYVELRWQGYTFRPNSSCEIQFRLRTAGWQPVWNAANDPSAQGLGSGSYAPAQNLPVYKNGTRVYGVAP